MLYPFWDEPFGYGVLMGLIAVLHVFVSHFAIGGGLFLALSGAAVGRASEIGRYRNRQQEE